MSVFREWDKELGKLKEGRKPSLLRAMVRTFGGFYMLLGLVALFEVSFRHILVIFIVFLRARTVKL